MKRLVMQAGVLILVTAGVGVLVTVSGVIPIKASSDHWAITKWMLTFAMSRSVTTNSSVVEAPSGWDEASMIMKGTRGTSRRDVPPATAARSGISLVSRAACGRLRRAFCSPLGTGRPKSCFTSSSMG